MAAEMIWALTAVQKEIGENKKNIDECGEFFSNCEDGSQKWKSNII